LAGLVWVSGIVGGEASKFQATSGLYDLCRVLDRVGVKGFGQCECAVDVKA